MSRRVVIIEDQTAIREMMRGAIDALEGFRATSFAGDFDDAAALCRRQQPDIVVLDLALPHGSGCDLIPILRSASPRARVVIFSGNLRPGTIRRALVSGAHGYVEKTAPLEELHRALMAAAAGQVYFSRFASEVVRRLVRGDAAGASRTVRLTGRDREVLRLVAEGLRSKEISDRLGLSHHTVANIRARLAKKTGLRGVAQLSRYAAQIGVVAEAVEGAAEAI